MANQAEVYFSPMRLAEGQTLASKLEKLCRRAGIETIDFERQFVAIKTHFGEDGNLAYLRPQYARVVVDLIKSLGGRPYLTDCSTLYPGRRKDALEHIELAYEHGFSPFSTNCQIIIGDGINGSDEQLVPIQGGQYVQEAKIGRAIMDADVFVSLSHFKGHIETGFGGALKNTGMGSGSRAGKQEMHASTGPKIREDACNNCQRCAKACASGAISYPDRHAQIDPEKCIECGHCITACKYDAIVTGWDEATGLLNAKIAEYAKAVLDGRPSFHISLAIDISPFCDCWAANDMPIVPDIGFFASFDPLALDQACADAVNAMPPNVGSLLDEAMQRHREGHGADLGHVDYAKILSPHSAMDEGLSHGEKIGLGTRDYRLIEVA
ncbi:MAG: DUF362 domain-containing protein [Coriobacteriia bacterium]|nr:DUF362 domain-containing protein [Coriobacteriia bacterium]